MIFKRINEIDYLIQEIYSTITNKGSNIDLEKVYENVLKEYPILKNYSLIIGTNDTTNNYFHKTIPASMNEQSFYDYNMKQNIFINHIWFEFSNIVYLSNKKNDQLVAFDSTVYIDSNVMNMIDKFRKSPQDYRNSFLDFKIKYDVDLNYLPYLLEDYINPDHESPKLDKTRDKIESFEIVNNLDKEFYHKSGEVRIDNKKLESQGYKRFEDFLHDKFFYFSNNFCEKKDCSFISISNNAFMIMPNKNNIDYSEYLSMYNIIYGYVLNILIEKNKENTVECKIHNILKNMNLNGQVMMEILFFSYIYFTQDDKYNINKFFNFDLVSWEYEKILKKARNIAWDIYLYGITKDFIVNPIRKINNLEYKADFGIPLFLTMDSRFYNAYIKFSSIQMLIIDESTDLKTYISINTNIYENEEFGNILMSFYDKNKDILKIKERILKKYSRKNFVYSIRNIFKERMESELKYFLKL